jgi:hypothetical protein
MEFQARCSLASSADCHFKISGGTGADGRIILQWIFRKWNGGDMGSIELAQDRDRWRALVDAVMKLRLP